MRAGERELQAGGQRGVEVEVVVGGADHLLDLREHGHHALRRRRLPPKVEPLPASGRAILASPPDSPTTRLICRPIVPIGQPSAPFIRETLETYPNGTD